MGTEPERADREINVADLAAEVDPDNPTGLAVSKKFYIIMAGVSLLVGIVLARIAMSNRENPQALLEGIALEEVDTYWAEKSASAEQVTMVPVITFRIRNSRQAPLAYVQVSAVFTVVGEKESLGDAFSYPIKGVPLIRGQKSDRVKLKSNYGYSGKTKSSFLNNSAFKPVQVRIFAQSRSSGMVPVGTFPITRRLEGMPAPPEPQKLLKVS